MIRRDRAASALPVVLLLLPLAGSVARAQTAATSSDTGEKIPTAVEVSGDATALYNAGTVALTHQAHGPAVAFLLAASRLEPRASDIRANLERALADADRAAGEEGEPGGGAPAIPLSPAESWSLAAALLAAGAAMTVLGAMRTLPRAARWAGTALLVSGLAQSAWLHHAAWEERAHPEAVVIVPSLSVERGPDEPSRPAVLLSAGERVRLGQTKSGLVEIRIGANRIGWAVREGLWRVSDAPRYTSRFEPGREQ